MRGKHTMRAPLGIVVASVMAFAGVAVGTAVPAAAADTDITITPVETNLAGKAWVSAKVSSGSAKASRAIDGDLTTAWVASRQRAGQWLTLDLGGSYDNVRKVEVVFPDKGAVYQYVIDASSNGISWKTVVDRSDTWVPGRGGVDLFTRPDTAYLRVTITRASPGATIGVSEISAFNYLRDDLVLGADISYADQNTTRDGLTYYVNDPAKAVDVLTLAKNSGMEYVRLRVFNDPRDERTGEYLDPAYQGPGRSATVAQSVKDEGMGLGIDLHYADSWADPNKQAKPTAWTNLSFKDLTAEVYDYTHDYIQELIDQGTTPEKVAVGNELINGFLWGSEKPQPWFTDPADWCASCYFNNDPAFISQPGGNLLWDYWGSSDPAEQVAYDAAWDRFTTLQAAGIKAVRDVAKANGADIKVETHVIIDNGKVDKTLEFWDQFLTRLKAKGQDIDVMAHSYYPEWHGTPEHFEGNLHAVAAAHPGYQLELAETSHPANDWDGVPVPNSPYPKTAQGQADAYQRVFQIANDLPDNRGIGALVWEPANYQEMIDWDNSAWPVLKVFGSIDVYNKSFAKHVLQDTVYTATQVRHAPHLPATVDALKMADGSIKPIAVTWDAVPKSATSKPGTVVVTGTTALGPVTAVVDVVRRLAPPIIVCTTFDRSDLAGPKHKAGTATKAGITVTKQAQGTWRWGFSDGPLNVTGVTVFSNGGPRPAGTSPGLLMGRHGSDIQWATFCTSGPAA